MAQRLNAYQLAELYSADTLMSYIEKLQTSLMSAAQGGYSLDTTQGKQTVTAPTDIASVESLLAVYVKALGIKNGTNEGTRMLSGGYAP